MFQVKYGLTGEVYFRSVCGIEARDAARGLSTRRNQTIEIARQTSQGWFQAVAYAYQGKVTERHKTRKIA